MGFNIFVSNGDVFIKRIMTSVKKKVVQLSVAFIFVMLMSMNAVAQNGSAVVQENMVWPDSVVASGSELLGKPYRYRLKGGTVLDCSGFVRWIFAQHDVELPRTAAEQANVTKEIMLNEVRKGDLLFFKGRNRHNKRVRHVALVVDTAGQKLMMMHSCRRGVVKECYYDSPYYKERYIGAGRLAVFNTLPDTLLKDSLAVADTVMMVVAETDTMPVLADSVVMVESEIQDTLVIIGVGDMMLGTHFPSKAYLPPNDGRDILKPVQHILQDADVTFGNMEGGILSGKGKVKHCSNPKVCYAFKMPNHYVNYFVDAGFDVVSIANNHVGDFGDAGRKNTVKMLDSAGIFYAGLLQYPSVIFEKEGVKYGFAAFAPNTGTVRITDLKNARRIVQNLDTLCDVVIVSFHGGAEGTKYRHITRETEMFLGENRGNPYLFARTVIDAGADVVFGHGPHVTRAIDMYKERFIAYSMGNFATYGRFNLRGISGVAPIIRVVTTRQGAFIRAKIISTRQPGAGGPVLDSSNRALQEIKILTAEDLPEAPVIIDDDGNVFSK